MTRPRFYRYNRGYGIFQLGLETYQYEEEMHLPHTSYVSDAYRVWVIHLGLWKLEWTV